MIAPGRQPRPWLVRALVLSALVKGIVLAVLIPPFQTPDEYGHYDYVLYLSKVPAWRFLTGDLARPQRLERDLVMTREVTWLAEVTGTLPHLRDAILPKRDRAWRVMFANAAAWRDTEEADLSSAQRLNALLNYPPLYHGTLAVGVRALRGLGINPLARFYAARLMSLACFLVALVVAARLLGWLGLPRVAAEVVLATLAWQPQLSMLSASVQPDNLGLLLVTAALLAIVRFASQPGTTTALGYGVVAGLVLLTKAHYAPPIWVAFVAAAILSRVRRQLTARDTVRALAVAGTASLAVAGWWHLRSHLLYGNWAGYMVFLPAGDAASIGDNLRLWWYVSVPSTFRSYWGMWGWFDYGIAPWTIPWLAAVSLAPAWLLALRALAPAARVQARENDGAAHLRANLWLLASATAVFAGELVAIGAVMGAVQNQGRHWLAFAVPEMVYLCAPVMLVAGSARAAFARLAERRAAPLRIAAALVALAAALCSTAWLVDRSGEGWVELHVRLRNADSRLALLSDTGVGFNTVDVDSSELRKREGWTIRRFRLAGRDLRDLRLDAVAPAGTLDVAAAQVRSSTGDVLAQLPLDRMVVLDGTCIPGDAGLISVTPQPGAARVSLHLPLDAPLRLPATWASPLVDPLRWVWHRVYRKFPAARSAGAAAPTLLLLALSLLLIGRAPRTGVAPVPPGPGERLLVLAYPALHIGTTVWLAAETWRFYRP